MIDSIKERGKSRTLTEFLSEYLEFSEKEKSKTASQSISTLPGKNNAQHNVDYRPHCIQVPNHRFFNDT